MNNQLSEQCHNCRRVLDNPTDPLSANCEGDCWGCVGEVEANAGHPDSLAQVRKECEAGLRPGWIDPLGL